MKSYKIFSFKKFKNVSGELLPITFDKKFDSLAYLVSQKLKDTLDQKFRAFNFRVDFSKYPKYNIGSKEGEDIKIKI